MKSPFIARKALVESLTRSPTRTYDELRNDILDFLEKEGSARYVPFEVLLDEAFERNVIENTENRRDEFRLKKAILNI